MQACRKHTVVIACMALVGHPQLPCYAVLFGACWSAASVAMGQASARRLACCASLAGAWVLAMLLSAVQLLPVAELAASGFDASRRGTAQTAALWAMDGGDLLGLVMPSAKGGSLAGLRELARGEYLHERGAYLGLATLALATYSLTRATTESWQWGLAWLCLAGAVFAVGQTTPLFGLIGGLVPGAFWFRCPGRIFGVVAPLAALLAGRGADALATRSGRGGTRVMLFFALFLSAAMVLMVSAAWQWLSRVGWPEYLSFSSMHLQSQFASLALTALATAAVVQLARRRLGLKPVVVYAALALVCVADLHAQTVSRFRLGPHGVRALPDDLQSSESPLRIASMPAWRQVRATNLRYSALTPTALASRRSAIDTYDGGILPSGVDQLYRAIENDPPVALSLAGCDYVFLRREKHWKPVRAPLPRVRFLPHHAANLWQAPLEEIGPVELARLRTALTGEANVVHEDSQRLSIRVDAPCAGALVVADTNYPGWIATVDGNPAPLETAHGVFRAVRLSAGSHNVELGFVSRSFQAGLTLSLCGALSTAAIALWGCYRSKRHQVNR